MIICGERLINDEKAGAWKCCILDQGHREDHKFEGQEYTEKKRQAILKLNTLINPNTPKWFNRQHFEFEKWTRDQQVSFGIRFLTIAQLLKWSSNDKLIFLHTISHDDHYVNDVMELNEGMNKMAINFMAHAAKDPLFKKQLEITSKEIADQELEKRTRN